MAEQDRREQILNRLAEVLATLAGVTFTARNLPDVPEAKRPAAVVFDGDEVAESPTSGRGRASMPLPIRCTMTPQVWFLAGGTGPDVGSVLNDLRSQAIKAVLRDDSLIELTKDGDITYLGFTTGLLRGRNIEGEAGIQFQFRYIVNPSAL